MNAPAQRAGRQVGTLAERLKLPGVGAALRNVGGALTGLVSTASRLALGGGLFGGGALMAMKKFIDYGDDIGTVSARIGVGSAALQELRYAAEQLDLPQEKLDAGLDKLSKNMGAAIARGGPMKAFFDAVGVDLKAGPLKAIETISDRIKGLSPELQREVVGTAFGRGNAEWVNALREGSPVLRRYREEAAELGFVLDEQTVSALGNADVELRRLKFAALGAAGIIGTELLPDVRAMIIAMTEWVKENREWIRSELVPEIRAFMRGVADTVPVILDLIEKIGGLRAVAVLTVGYLAGPALLAIGQFAASIATTAAAWVGLNGLIAIGSALLNPWLLGIAAVSIAMKQLYDRWEPFRYAVDWWWEKIKGVAGWVGSNVIAPWSEAANSGKYGMRWDQTRAGGRTAPQAPEQFSAMAIGPASGYAGTPHLFTGNIGIDLSLPRGASGTVGPMKASRGLGLDVGLTQGM